MGDGFDHRAAGFLLKKELTYFSKVCIRFPKVITLSLSGPRQPQASLPCYSRGCQGGRQDPADREHAGQGRRDDYRWWHGLHLQEGHRQHAGKNTSRL